MVDLEVEKAAAAARAIEEIQAGMVVGLGTGSTAACAVRCLGRRVADGLRITAVATSQATESLARQLAIPLVALDGLSRVDLTIDGADEIDPQLRAIKGGGGALLREKIVATASDRMIVIVDSSKPVAQLGRARLPVETLPFAATFVRDRLAKFDAGVVLRRSGTEPFATDQGNHIFDMSFSSIPDPERLAAELAAIPGIVGHGLFLNEIDRAVIARRDTVTVIDRERTRKGAPPVNR